jgi:ATP-dependent RNA helicase DDX42
VLDDDGLKWDWLTQRLAGMVNDGSVIIFVGKKAAVDELAGNLRTHALIECGTLHGDMPQWERDKVIHDMKTGKLKTLVCTDVAARGLDIKQVRNVVNFDTARDIDSHVHRCGRTGRAGEKGTAYTLVTKAEDRFAADLVRNMEESGQPVPPELVDVAMKNSRFRKARTAFGGRDGLRGGSAHRGRGRGRGGIGLSASGGLGGAGRGGRGVGDYNGGGRGFNANLTPVGMTSRSEWKPHSSHITAPVSTFRPSNTIPGAVPISRGGSILSSFQRASSAQGKSTSFVNQSTSNYSSRSPKSN